MINILSYIGMTVHSEVCLWTLLGLIRTIFDATLFRVNANLKQVWQMSMPEELSMSVQRVLRTMISGVMLVHCFTVYVYLASYIVLLYPVFLEERPNLVLPWLLLAAVRKLLCELTSLALGLGTCVLLGPARPPCIKFVIIKLIAIIPALYMWMLLFSYYDALKMATSFKTFPAVLPPCDQDYGLELAIRRRRTKSLLGEDQLRSKLVASLYGHSGNGITKTLSKIGISSRMMHSTDTSAIDLINTAIEAEVLRPNSLISNRMSETGSYEDWFGSEVVLPRGCDRILEQFVLMLLRIQVYLIKEESKVDSSQRFNSKLSHPTGPKYDNLNCAMSTDAAETPLLVGSSKGNTASYLREYPQIFMKKSVDISRSENARGSITIQTRLESEDGSFTTRIRKHSVTVSSKERISLDIEKVISRRNYIPQHKNIQQRKPSLKEIELNEKDKKTDSSSGIHEKENSDKILTIKESSTKVNEDDKFSRKKYVLKNKDIQQRQASKEIGLNEKDTKTDSSSGIHEKENSDKILTLKDSSINVSEDDKFSHTKYVVKNKDIQQRQASKETGLNEKYINYDSSSDSHEKENSDEILPLKESSTNVNEDDKFSRKKYVLKNEDIQQQQASKKTGLNEKYSNSDSSSDSHKKENNDEILASNESSTSDNEDNIISPKHSQH